MKKSAIVLLLVLGCGGEKSTPPPAAPPKPTPPTIEQARTLVAESPEFSEYQFTNAAYSLPMDRRLLNAPAREVANALKKAGWISFDGAGNVVLQHKAEIDRRFLVRSNGVVDIVPLAKKEFGDVTSVNGDVAAFTWTWKPNEIGALFGSRYEGVQNANATLLWDGSKWTILKIEPAPPPPATSPAPTARP